MVLNRLHFRSTSPSESAATLDGRAVRNSKGRSRAFEGGTGAPLMVELDSKWIAPPGGIVRADFALPTALDPKISAAMGKKSV
jgi:hypothetical protein